MTDESTAPEGRTAPGQLDWWCPSSLRLHAVMVVGVGGSLAAGWFEWTRARAGHEIAWVYTFEWPLFAVMGIYLWWQLLHPERRPGPRLRRGDPRGAPDAGTDADDPDLVAWQAYLARLHASDPPGGPPPARGRVK